VAESALGYNLRTDGAARGQPSPVPSKLDTTLAIETPERVVFNYLLAGPALRTAAYLLDLLLRLVFVVAVLLGLSIGAIATSRLHGFETGLLLVLFFALEWGYFVFFELVLSGSSPGKRVFGLRVMHESGRPLTAAESVLRNLLRAADLLPSLYALGLGTMCFDRKFRRLGDLVAGTVVVREPRVRLRRRTTPAEHREVAGLPARPRLTRDELAALALFERRAAELGQSRAAELAELWAPRLRVRFGVPRAPATDLLVGLLKRAARP